MPKISEDEYKKFKELLEKEKKEREQKVLDRITDLEQLSERVQGLLDLNKTYGTLESYARIFAKFLDGDMEAHKTDFLFFDWNEIQRYLTKRCIDRNQHGNLTLNPSFRKRLKELGYRCVVDNTWKVFKVEKCEPRKK